MADFTSATLDRSDDHVDDFTGRSTRHRQALHLDDEDDENEKIADCRVSVLSRKSELRGVNP